VTRTQFVAISSGGGADTSVFGGIAAVGAALAGIGTLLTVFATVRVRVQLAQAEITERTSPAGPAHQVRSYLPLDEQDQEHD
jgi:hypothetical protein